MTAFYNWWTDVLVTFVVIGFLIANWLDWGFLYKSYSPLNWPRNKLYITILLGLAIIQLIIIAVLLYPH